MMEEILDNFDSILIPKVESPKDLEVIDSFLDRKQNTSTKLHATIESAKGLVNLKQICESSSRLESLVVSNI